MKYGVILADPPWAYRNRQNGAAEKHYPVMSTAALTAIPVREWATDDAVLVLWSTWPMQPQAIELIDAWGFCYVSGFPWLKTTKLGSVVDMNGELIAKPMFGPGYWLRGMSEPVLIAKRGKAKPPSNSWLGLIAPVMDHSRKPANIYEYCESMPTAQYGLLELFARSNRPGWVCWGDELGVAL